MFKFKMSLLVKSAKFKVAIVTLLIVAILSGIVFIPKNKASEKSSTVNIKANKLGVTIGGLDLFLIQKDGEATGYNNLFCIEEGEDLVYKTFESSQIVDISNAQGYFNHYNAARWLINNMYVSNAKGTNGLDDDKGKNILLTNMATLITSDSVKNSVMKNYGFDGSNITPQTILALRDLTIGGQYQENAIEMVEQIALWKYTKGVDRTRSDTYRMNPNQFLEGANITADQQRTLKYIFYGLSALADIKDNTTFGSTIQNYVTLDSSAAKFNESTYKVGPYYLKSNDVTLTSYGYVEFPLEVTITKNDGSKETKINDLMEKNLDGSFFINLSAYKNNVKRVDFKFDNVLSTVNTEAYILDGGEQQNLMGIEKSISKTSLADGKDIKVTPPTPPTPVTPEGNYSVVLKKVKEDGTTVIKDLPAKFKVNGKEQNTENGILNITNSKKIENVNATDSYEITETEAPNGYTLFNGTLKFDVKFKQVDKTYVIDRDKTTSSGFTNGAKIDINENNTVITITVPNKQKTFDLSLRKFISKVDGKDVTPSREPIINVQSIINLQQTGTASYYHVKDSIGVNAGSEIEYTLRVYNEGEILGYAKEITDYLPEGLSFVKIADESQKLYTTDSAAGSKVVVLKYKGNTNIKTLRDFYNLVTYKKADEKVDVTNEYYQQVKIICKVENSSAQYITSRGEITNYGYEGKNAQGESVWKDAKEIGNVDRDSIQNTIKDNLSLDTWYENAKERTYKDKDGKTVTDKNYYPGVQDDDDFETVEVLSGKYNIIIRKVDSKNKDLKLEGAYFSVKGTNIDTEVGPTNRDGLVSVVKGVKILNEKQVDEYTIKETTAPVNYNPYSGEIKVNVATKFNGTTYVIDSEKTKVNGKDVTFEVNKDNTTITINVPNTKKTFDLSLRKFITKVNGEELSESREPKVDVSKLASGESTTATYEHSKEPVDVNTTDVVTYTIRVFNEGEIDGYATKIMDDIPEGLEFLPENETNKKYKWVMYTEVKSEDNVNKSEVLNYNGKSYVKTNKPSEADFIVSDYLSLENGKENLIKAFNAETKTLDYKDVEVAFKVVEPQTSDRIVINHAQITEHGDSNGTPDITDRDSTPNKWNDGEDDQDIDKVRVRYFDLALRKWVTKAIVTENGKTTVTKTGHGPWDDPEPVVKVDLKNTDINNVVVKFEYSIRVYNQGQIAGYAKEVSDYIPQGLKFVAQDNPQWTEVDGKIVTTALENTLLQPGDYADVTVVLTWINGSDNLGLKTNTAEISKDHNDWGTPDIDSTPNNQVPGEDDIDDAPVILTVRTGEPIIYTGIAIGAIAIISLGIVIIRKKVLTK